MALLLWVIPLNALIPVIFNLSTQGEQQTRLQTQIVQMENLHHQLQDQETTLKQQQRFLQKQIASGDGGQVTTQVKKDAEQTTTNLLSGIDNKLQYLNSLVSYDISLQEENTRNLARDELISDTQNALNRDEQAIKSDQQFVEDLNPTIEANNAVLSVAENVHVVWIDQASCVRGYPCQGSSWRQPFINGWRNVTQQPLSITWLFWVLLTGGMAGLFLLLPLTVSKTNIITYRVLYYGLVC